MPMEDTYGIQSRIGSIIVVERWYCCRGSPVFSDRNIQLLLADRSTENERLQMLNQKRNRTLDEIHFKEKQLDRLDYLRYEIQQANGE